MRHVNFNILVFRRHVNHLDTNSDFKLDELKSLVSTINVSMLVPNFKCHLPFSIVSRPSKRNKDYQFSSVNNVVSVH